MAQQHLFSFSHVYIIVVMEDELNQLREFQKQKRIEEEEVKEKEDARKVKEAEKQRRFHSLSMFGMIVTLYFIQGKREEKELCQGYGKGQ